MGRVLVFLVLAFVVWYVVRQLGASRKRDAPAAAPAPAPAAPRAIESITQCAWCGVHVPEGQALLLPDGRLYCCEAHRESARIAAGKVPPS